MVSTTVAPPLDELEIRNEDERIWTHPIAVLGACAATFIDQATGGSAADRALVELGMLRGWSLRLALYGLDASTPERVMRDHLARCRGWVVAPERPGQDPIWARLEQLTRWVDAQRPEVVIAVFGDEALARTWRAYGGREPVAREVSSSAVLAALTRALLRPPPK